MHEFIIRPARPEDAQAISDVLKRSITALCAADHLDDPDLIEGWIADKTPEEIGGRIIAGTQMFVTESAGQIGAVGEFQSKGHIDLLYVAPEAQGQGHSRALLADMENRLRDCGAQVARLVSSKTAQSFYLKRGWEIEGTPVVCYTTDGQPMRKVLVPSKA